MNPLKIIKYVFSIVGATLLVMAMWLCSNTKNFIEHAISAQGEVVEVVRSRSSDSTTYRPVVIFKTREGAAIEFTSTAGSNPPSYRVGEVVEVLYQSENPHKAKINGFFSIWGLPIIFGGMGAVFFLVGASIFTYERYKRNKIAHLKRYGMPIRAKFIGVERNSSIKMNGRRAWQICAQWRNTQHNEIHVFKSDNLWFDPTEYVPKGDLTVFIDLNNPKKYHMDIEFLPILK